MLLLDTTLYLFFKIGKFIFEVSKTVWKIPMCTCGNTLQICMISWKVFSFMGGQENKDKLT